MTIYTFKLSKKKLIGVILIIAILIAAIIIAVPGRDTGGQRQTSAGAITKVKTADDGAEYAGALGYEVRPEPADVRKVTIPKAFDEVYQKYNEIQKENGYDLEGYCGKGVTLYTYYVTNYAGYDDVLLDLLVYKNKVIGGAVYTAAIDGFMHGLIGNPTLS